MTWIEWLEIVANILGVVSFILGIFTLVNTEGIKKSMLKTLEKSDYINDIDSQVLNLESYYNTAMQDSSLYNDSLLMTVDGKLDDIMIQYETILPKKLLSQITELRNYIKTRCLKSLSDKEAKNEFVKKLHSIIARLRKVKKTL